MSGWVKIEKDLLTDQRVVRIAKAISRRYVLFDIEDQRTSCPYDPCNAAALPAVTLVVGALAKLWCYADSHAREDDTVDLSLSEVDELVGIPGFAAAMPEEWLRSVSDYSVELPYFHEHNGVEAKRRALSQKRVARHRDNVKRSSVAGGNAPPLPDQTRPDQDQKGKSIVGLAPDAAKPFRKEAKRVIQHLNAKAGRRFDINGANADHIVARLKEGETVETCLAIVEDRCARWLGDPKMAEYLRPQTLFNRSKFASYKGELGSNRAAGDPFGGAV